MRDLCDNLDVKRGVSPAAAGTDNTAIVSQIVDLADYEGAMFVFLCGALTDTNAAFTTLVESGNDSALSDAAATPDNQLNGTEALASFDFSADNKVFKVGVRCGYKRYARVTVTPAGNDSGNIFLAGVWVLSPKIVPAANPPV